MTKWSKSRHDIFYYDAEVETNKVCEVILSDGELTVSYYDDDVNEHVVYKGKETSPGHFELTAPMVQGRAVLHRLPQAMVLEGGWEEDGARGMWRIELE